MSEQYTLSAGQDPPPVPDETVAKWQSTVDLIAEIMGVSAGVVLRYSDAEYEIVATNERPDNPFKRGERRQRDPAAYCEATLNEHRMMLISDAEADPAWRHSPGIALGLVAYVGYPLEWPGGRIFGTLCLFDTKPNPFSDVYCRLLEKFKESIEGDLALLTELKETRHTQEALLNANARLQEQVARHEQLSAALRKSEERLRGYFDSPLLGVSITGPRDEWIEFNDALCRMLGYSREELKRLIWRDVTHPDDIEVNAKCRERLTNGELNSENLGKRFIRKDGRVIYTQVALNAIRDAQGRVECFAALIEDVTDRRDAEEQLAAYRQHLESLVAARTSDLTEANSRLRSEIQQRTEAEAALRDSVQRFQAVFRESPMGILVLGVDGVYRELNPAAIAILGYTLEEINRVGMAGIVHPDDVERNRAANIEVLEGRSDSLRAERRYIRTDGEVIWCDLAASLVRDGKGAPQFVIAMIEDITQRKKAEEALKQSEELFRTAQELSLDGFVVLRAERDESGAIHDFVCVYANPSALRILNRPVENTHFTESFPSVKTHSILFSEYSRVIETGKPHDGEFRYEADGLSGWFRNMAVRLNDGLVVSFCDITARKHAEQERVRLATAVEQAAEAILITDAQGLIQYVNPAFERISGYTRDEVLGQNPRILKSNKQDDDFYRRMWTTVMYGQVWRGQLVNLRKDGTSYVEQLSVTPIRAEGDEITHFVAIMEDVSERLQLEAQFRQAQKLEAVGRLAGGVAHDFNNLLTAILGSSDLLISQLHQDDPLLEEVLEIKRAGERAASLTRQLLAFSRRQVLQPRVIVLNEIVLGMEKMLRRLIGEDIQMESRMAVDLQPLRADSGQIEQILLNLVVNARDAMPSGGRLILETRSVRVEPSNQIDVEGALFPGEYLELSVTDSGIGIGEDVVPHIFEPFFTTKEEGKGTGLGLCTVYGIARQSGGTVTFENAPGGGATFRVLLPVANCADEAPAAVSRSAETASGGETILVAEDEDMVRGLVCRVLRLQGYTVLEASNGAEALTVLRDHAGPLQLVLSDVIMPGMYGPELAAHALLHRPDLRVIFMTGHADRFLSEVGSANGAAPILSKPFTPQQLVTLVRRILREPSRG